MGTIWSALARLQGWGGWAAAALMALGIFRVVPHIMQQLTARRQLDQTGALTINALLMARVTALETAGEMARKDCDRQLTELRTHFEQQLAKLRGEYDGLLRQFRQVESSAARTRWDTPPDFEALADRIGEKREPKK